MTHTIIHDFPFSANITIIFTGVYWKMTSLTYEDLFTTTATIFAYSLNLATCYISIIFFNAVGDQFVDVVHEVMDMQRIMAEIGIPYSTAHLYQVSRKLAFAVLPILLMVFYLTPTLEECTGVLYPYFVRILCMSFGAQISGGALETAGLYAKLLKRLKKNRQQYTQDQQIEITHTATKLMWMYQNLYHKIFKIFDVIFLINIYANRIELAFVVGYIYIQGLQHNTFFLTWLIMYIPGNLIHFFIYTSMYMINIRVSTINKYLTFVIF